MRRLLLITGLVPACTSSMHETAVVEQGACIALEGRTFVSADGLGQVTFDVDSARASHFTWSRNDATEVGQVTCTGRAIKVTSSSRTATFDPYALRLEWAGETYVAQ